MSTVSGESLAASEARPRPHLLGVLACTLLVHLAAGLSLQAVPVLAPVPLTESGVALQRLGPVASTTAAGTTLVLLVAFAVQLLRRTGPYSSHGAGAEGQPLPNPLALLHRRDGLPQLAGLACALAAAQIACVLFAVSYVVEGLVKSHGEAMRAPIQIVAL